MLCAEHAPHLNCGKLIVATNDAESEARRDQGPRRS
jgi:hypothetical protein